MDQEPDADRTDECRQISGYFTHILILSLLAQRHELHLFRKVGGALTIARWRVIGLVVGTLWVGTVLLGFGYDLLLAAHLF
jgi:hypothetical protein